MDGNLPNLRRPQDFPLLFEMLRSFTVLAQTLNLSHAVQELGSTRQTVRRHINQLEEALGGPLFQIEDRQYKLTGLGQRELPMALDLLGQARGWMSGELAQSSGLQSLRTRAGDWSYHQQQHPVGRIWQDSSPLFAETFRAWSLAGASIEHPALAHVRPFLIVYRHAADNWVCVEFGERSFYVNWFGLDYARSSIGRPLGKMPAGEHFARMLDQSFLEVQETQSARLDHVYTQVPRIPGDGLVPVAYERLMMCGRFPDQSLAVVALVIPRHDVDIEGVTKTDLERLDDTGRVTFDKSDIRLSDLQL